MFSAHRAWDAHTIIAFNAARDEKRARSGLKSFAQLSDEEKNALRGTSHKANLIKTEWTQMTLQSCPLDKPPMRHVSADNDGVLLCPRTFVDRQSFGKKKLSVTKVQFYAGQELFRLAHYHYSERATEEEMAVSGSRNYINNEDGISPRRYEFLGPQPYVSGFYRNERGEMEILFWDSYLNLAWCGNSTWSVDAEFDDKVHAWVPVIRLKSD